MSFAEPELDYFVRSFHPGYMDTPEADTIPKGGTPDAKNCLFASLQLGSEPRAVLDKRTGARLLTVPQVDGTSSFDGLCEFRKVGQISGRIVAVLNGKAWYWDGVSAFVQIGATAPFAVGVKVQFFTSRNLLFIMDGVTMRCWDGVLASDLFTPGQIAPTVAGALTVAAGPGVTGTYEGYQVWYDSTHDHETSPSALTAQVPFVNQQRTWAKPAGAPGATYDFWRVYCRRIDTNESYYKKVADVAIATASVTEAMTDAIRNLAPLGPLPTQNDPPPLTFVFQMEFQGYRLGVVANDDQLYVSKLGDPQSQRPSDILGVTRGSGGELRSAMKFGTEAVLQKAAKTYRLKGDRMPFIPEEVHSTFGNVGPQSAVEVKGRFFAWDEDNGPYWTDLQLNWEPIGTARVHHIITSVPKTQARYIECVHHKVLNLVIWSVPQGSSARRRTLIAWHTELGSWLPPITGLEYAALTTLIDAAGDAQLYVGDYWGRLFQYFTDNVEGVPSGTLVARVLSSTSGSVTCDVALTFDAQAKPTVVGAAVAFFTSGAGLTGLPVLHIDARGNTQWRRIQSNTGSVITLDTINDSAWNSLPAAGSTIVVGGIDWYWRSPLIDYGEPFRQKLGRRLEVHARPGSAAFSLATGFFREGFSAREYTRHFTLANSAVWGSGLWGSIRWGAGAPTGLKTRINRSFFSCAVELANPYPNMPVSILGVRVSADALRGRLRASGGDD